MKSQTHILVVLMCGLLLTTGCTSAASKKTDIVAEAIAAAAPQRLPLPEVPATCITPDQRAEFVVMHYWDHFDFADTTLIAREDYTEQAFVDFVNLLPHVPMTLAARGIESLMHQAEADKAMYAHFMGLAEKYYDEPNSPYRNEELYIQVLRTIIASQKLDAIDKLRPQYQLDMALKNRVGQPATDFAYTTLKGGKSKLYAAQGDYILLFFFRPDCESCQQTKAYLETHGLDRLVTLVWVNPEQDTHLDGLYDLRASPTLYLLDGMHTVLLKDASIEQIDNYLQTATRQTDS